MERMTFEGHFCDIAQCENVPGGSFARMGRASNRAAIDILRGVVCDPETQEAIDIAISVIQERIEREKNKPLTIEELREMDGQPVWIVDNTWLPYGSCGIVSLWPPDDSGNKHIYIYDAKHGARSYSTQEYERCWTACRYKPKKECEG